jgi:hypothetical protein
MPKPISDAVLRDLVLEACRKALAAGETLGDASLRKHGARGDCTRLLAMRDGLIRSGEIVLPAGMRLTRPTANPGRARAPKPVDPTASPLADTIREARAAMRRLSGYGETLRRRIAEGNEQVRCDPMIPRKDR